VGITTSYGADHQQVISVPDTQVPALQSFVERMLQEACLAFGEAGAQLVLAQWAQKTIGDALPAVDELGQRRYSDGQEGVRRHG
jgi:hypothetical protein